MKFKFNITLNEKDYLDYNVFSITKSPYGKKQMKSFRFTIGLVFAVVVLMCLYGGSFSLSAFLSVIPTLIFAVLFQIFMPNIMAFSVRWAIKKQKTSGKMGFAPISTLEFDDEVFIETTPDNKTETKYPTIERISIVNKKVMYIHVNNVASYILPLSCFETKEQYDEFIKFIGSKCSVIEHY